MSIRHKRKLNIMRAAKISQLTKSLERITDLNTDINNAVFNNRKQSVIEKLQAREYKACEKAYNVCRTMTEAEYDATEFADVMCIDYSDAIA